MGTGLRRRFIGAGLLGVCVLYPPACSGNSTGGSNPAGAAGDSNQPDGGASGSSDGSAARGGAGGAPINPGGGAGGSSAGASGIGGASGGGGASGIGGASGGGVGGSVGASGARGEAGSTAEAGSSGEAGGGPVAGPVQVTVLVPDGSGKLVASVGRSILFTDAQHSSTVATDAQGKATANVLPDAVVTLMGYTTPADLVSTFGVQPGDTLVYDAEPGCGASEGSMTATLPAFAGAVGYELRGNGITGSGLGPAISLTASGCFGPASDLLALAKNAYATPLAYVLLKNVPFLDGSSVAFGTWTALAPYSVAYSGIVENSVIETTLGTGTRDDQQIIRGSTSSTNATETASLPFVGFGDPVHVSTRVLLAGSQDQFIYDSFPRGTPASLDITTNLLPWISNANLDLATRTVTWSVTQPGAITPDGVVLRLLVRNAYEQHWWTIIAPGSGLQLPFLPLTPPGVVADVYPALVESSDYADYTALRRAHLSNALRTVNGYGTAALTRVSYAQGDPTTFPTP